jgi:hypothetical protein
VQAIYNQGTEFWRSMTRTPFDAFSKDVLEELLTPYGSVETSQEVPGETRLVDVRFIPTPQPRADLRQLGLLGRMAASSCLIEPFRNPPSRSEVRNCLLKLFLVQAEVQRQARREEERILESALPYLWILAPSASDNFLQDCASHLKEGWLSGVYFLGEVFRSAIIALDQLPVTDETLWLRLLGRGPTQQQAITEVLNLPPDAPLRMRVLQLLANWKISLEVTQALEQEDQTLMATLSQAYLEWEQQTEQRGIERGRQEGIERERSLVLRQLSLKVGELPSLLQSRIEALPLDSLEALGEALLNFSTLADLEAWLTQFPPA